MTTTDTGTDIKSLDALKEAVRAVTKANKSWLLALETFLEGIDPNSTGKQQSDIAKAIKAALPSTLLNIIPSTNLLPDQALRLALDEVTFLQLADRKLEGKVSRLESTSENLGKAVVEAESYLVVTDEAFTFLKDICIRLESDKILGSDLATQRQAADVARTYLVKQVAGLLSPGGVTLPPPEPERTELLFGKSFGQCADEFLALMPPGTKETAQTQTLLSRGHLTLSDKQINALTNGWGKVVKKVSDDLAGSTPTFTIADLFCIHSTLDTLYDRLETNITRTDVDIVSSEI